MAKDADVHIAITSERKEEWEEFLEENSNLDSMTELVRHGVGDYIERSQSGGDDGVQEIDWEPVLQPLNELQGGMEEAVQGIEFNIEFVERVLPVRYLRGCAERFCIQFARVWWAGSTSGAWSAKRLVMG